MTPKDALDRIYSAIYYNKKDRWSKNIKKKFIKKGKVRVPDLEDLISNCPVQSYKYATQILKSKLPEKMHNKMLCYAMANHAFAKEYFKHIKQNLI